MHKLLWLFRLGNQSGGIMNARILKILLASLIIASCASSPPTLTANLPAANPDKGLVIFYRMSSFKGKAIRFNISHNEGMVGQLLSGTTLHKYFEPGEHTFTVQGVSLDGFDSVTVNLEAGEIYYFKGSILWGWPAGRPKFAQIPEAEAQADLAKLK